MYRNGENQGAISLIWNSIIKALSIRFRDLQGRRCGKIIEARGGGQLEGIRGFQSQKDRSTWELKEAGTENKSLPSLETHKNLAQRRGSKRKIPPITKTLLINDDSWKKKNDFSNEMSLDKLTLQGKPCSGTVVQNHMYMYMYTYTYMYIYKYI